MNKLNNQLRTLLLFLSVTLTGSACGGDINSLLGQILQAETTVAPVTTQAESLPSEYIIDPATTKSGLEQLDSYRANLIVDFEGTRNGQPAAGRIETLTEINRSADILHYYVYVDAAIPGAEDVIGISEFFRVGDRVYVSKADGEAFSFDTDTLPNLAAGKMGLLEPDKLIIIPPMVTTLPITETLHGLPARRYSFTTTDINSSNLVFEQAQGDLWVAELDKYLMQYVISATVKTATPIANAHILDEGRLNLSYTLTDINTDFEITPPDNIETTITPLAQFPRPEGVRVTAVFPTLLEYTSVISPISATMFYQTGLPPNGWAEESVEIFEEKSRLIYAKENQTLTILIAPGETRNEIKVSLNLDTQP